MDRISHEKNSKSANDADCGKYVKEGQHEVLMGRFVGLDLFQAVFESSETSLRPGSSSN